MSSTTTATRRTLPVGGMIWGAAAIVIKLIIPALPVFSGHSISQGTDACNGTIGTLAQAFSHKVSYECTVVNGVNMGLTVAAGICVIVAVACGIAWFRRGAA